MQSAESREPRRGCPFVGPPRPGARPEGLECVGLGRCHVCPRWPVGLPVVASRFRVQRFLASGYYADVFQARDAVTDEEVALKVYADDPPRRSAWSHETAALTHLAHARIPRLRAALEVDGWLAVAMDLVGGSDLRGLAESAGPLSVERVISLGLDVAEALEHIASLGWTYRDLHPRNVHVGTRVGAMLLDLDGARPPGWPAYPSGRAGYRAPELESAGDVAPACDVFSLAGCLYFALTALDPPAEPGCLPLVGWPAVCAPLRLLLDGCRVADPPSRPSIGEVRRTLQGMTAHWMRSSC